MSWDKWEKAADDGPEALIKKGGCLLIVVVFVAGVCGIAYRMTVGVAAEAATVAREEFGPRAALAKYEWFKDAAAELEKKRADIGVYETRLASMSADYEGKSRSEWDRVDKQQLSQWQAEVAGVTASYNALAAEYNSASSKFNWAMFDKTELPREFKVYVSE